MINVRLIFNYTDYKEAGSIVVPCPTQEVVDRLIESFKKTIAKTDHTTLLYEIV